MTVCGERRGEAPMGVRGGRARLGGRLGEGGGGGGGGGGGVLAMSMRDVCGVVAYLSGYSGFCVGRKFHCAVAECCSVLQCVAVCCSVLQ